MSYVHPVDSWCAANSHICTSLSATAQHNLPAGRHCEVGKGECLPDLICVGVGIIGVCSRGAANDFCITSADCHAPLRCDGGTCS